jgi:hypothetical protein
MHKGRNGRNAISRHLADDYIARRIFALIQDATSDSPEPGTMDVVTEAARVFSAALEAPQTAAERDAVVRERADAQNALGELYDDLDAGLYAGQTGRARFLTRKARIEERISAAAARLEELSGPENVTLPLGEWLQPGDDGDPIGPGSWWAEASLSDRRTLVELFVHQITVLPAHTRNVRPKGGYDVSPRLVVEWVHPALNDDAE